VVFAQNGHLHQAAQAFTRARAMAPELLAPRLWLAQICLSLQLPDQSLQVVEGIHAEAQTLGLSRTNVTDLLSVEASAHLLKNDLPGAEQVVAKLEKEYPANEDLLATATEVYMKYGRYTNALATIEQQLQIRPDNPTALVNQGFSCLQLNAFERAIAPLSRVVSMETTNFTDLHYNALFNRAIAYLRSDKLAESQQDYEVLQKTFPTAFKVAYGLGEIAFRKKDTNAAMRNYQLYLENAPTNTAEAELIRTRLKELKGGAS
jgi:tetratricopeptide (TPR) repeat protein